MQFAVRFLLVVLLLPCLPSEMLESSTIWGTYHVLYIHLLFGGTRHFPVHDNTILGCFSLQGYHLPSVSGSTRFLPTEVACWSACCQSLHSIGVGLGTLGQWYTLSVTYGLFHRYCSIFFPDASQISDRKTACRYILH